ncbi:Fic family protein [Nitrospina sp. 32_T5]|uniref:Fic family protein n=1 Tax=unclassified Nitrospina TaxID=2638683 RepID=UPI003F9B4497
MKIPERPPDPNEIIFNLHKEDPQRVIEIFSKIKPLDDRGRYLHWEKMKYLEPPQDFTAEEWWAGTKMARRGIYRELSLRDKRQNSFKYSIPDCVLKDLLWLEKNTAGSIQMDRSITSPESRDTYLVSSLFDEAISSSQLEGAATTYKDAKEMLREGRKPIDIGQQMIFNNHQAMLFINENLHEKLTPEMIRELHRILVEDTLKNLDDAGNLRTKKDNVLVVDSRDNTVLHVPPNADELPERLERLCQFANESSDHSFLPAPLKAITLHFMLAYDHPFVDGNGRTARALFYWYMAKTKYWMIQYISISQILKKEFGQYKKSYLYVETDENDLTYFFIHQLSSIRKAANRLNEYLRKKSVEIESVKKLLEKTNWLKQKLNYRQLALLRHALDHPHFVYTIESHKNSHGVFYDTARKDLLAMSDKYGLLEKEKSGRAFIFIAPPDIKKRLSKKFK